MTCSNPAAHFPRPHWHGVNFNNLRPLSGPLESRCPYPPVPVRFGLVNARSLSNMTFILKDFFTSRGLDFLCVTETWVSVGESSAFSQLLPQDYCYFNSLLMLSRGGGTATIFKSHYQCKKLSLSSSYTNFELGLFELGLSHTVLCAFNTVNSLSP